MQDNIQKFEKSFFDSDIECLTISIAIPCIVFDGNRCKRFEKYYNHKINQIINMAVKHLLPYAKKDIKSAVDGQCAYQPWRIKADCRLTMHTNELLSALRETSIYHGRKKQANFIESETWNLATQFCVPLKGFVSSKKAITNALRNFAGRDNALRKYLTSYFNRENFYVTPNGVVIFYQNTDYRILIPQNCIQKQQALCVSDF